MGVFDRGDYTIREDVTMQRGRHEIHVGGEVVRVSNNLVNTFRQSGEFSFSNQISGNNLSDFILGDASNFTQGGGEFKNLKGVLWSLYAQDNIRVTPKLRVEIGLRWDPYFPFTETRGRVVCYLPGTNHNLHSVPKRAAGNAVQWRPGLSERRIADECLEPWTALRIRLRFGPSYGDSGRHRDLLLASTKQRL